MRLCGDVAVVPVLRAGLSMVEGFLRLLPDARVGHLGMQRDEMTHSPHGYFERLPPHLAETHVFVLDPMLATGGSALYALDRLREAGARHVRLICLVCAPEGVAAVRRAPSRRADLDRRAGPLPRRERLHPAGPRRRGRPRLRHAP